MLLLTAEMKRQKEKLLEGQNRVFIFNSFLNLSLVTLSASLSFPNLEKILVRTCRNGDQNASLLWMSFPEGSEVCSPLIATTVKITFSKHFSLKGTKAPSSTSVPKHQYVSSKTVDAAEDVEVQKTLDKT